MRQNTQNQFEFNVKPQSLDYALAHLTSRGDTDILPPAFELAAIEQYWADVREELSNLDLSDYVVRPARTFLSPKKGLGFRIATQLDPLDCILITAIVYEIGEDIESSRVSVSEEIVHSYRYAPTPEGQLYSPDYSFRTFRQKSLELAAARDGFVLMTDIADFYQRIYFHRLENALSMAVSSLVHRRAICRMIKAWNQSVSYGLPVGPAIFQLLAELTIDDVDQSLLGNGIEFCRYSDDYRIVVDSEREAREACAAIAEVLLRNHGLTIQESKTEILSTDEFCSRFKKAESDAARAALGAKFSELLSQLQKTEPEVHELHLSRADEWDESEESEEWEESGEWGLSFDDYLTVDFMELSEDLQDVVDSLDLWGVLEEQLSSDRAIDISLTSFVLRRIAELCLQDEEGILLKDLRRLYPLFSQVIEALAVQYPDDVDRRRDLGNALLDLFGSDVVGHIPYHRAWILRAFSDDSWGDANRLARLYDQYPDDLTRPALLEAMGNAQLAYWFRSRKAGVAGLPSWEQRAFLAGARCLPTDEADHWYRSVIPQLDLLGRIVGKWAHADVRGRGG